MSEHGSPSLVKPLVALAAALGAAFYAGRWSGRRKPGPKRDQPAAIGGKPPGSPKGARKPIVNVGGPLASTPAAPALPAGPTS